MISLDHSKWNCLKSSSLSKVLSLVFLSIEASLVEVEIRIVPSWWDGPSGTVWRAPPIPSYLLEPPSEAGVNIHPFYLQIIVNMIAIIWLIWFINKALWGRCQYPPILSSNISQYDRNDMINMIYKYSPLRLVSISNNSVFNYFNTAWDWDLLYRGCAELNTELK